MKTLLMITLLLLGVTMSAAPIVAKVPIEGGFEIKLGEKMTPERLSELGSTGQKDRTGKYHVYPYGKKNLRIVYFVSTNASDEVYEIYVTTGFDAESFGHQYHKVFALRYGDIAEQQSICYVDPTNNQRTLVMMRIPAQTIIIYRDAGLSNREKAK